MSSFLIDTTPVDTQPCYVNLLVRINGRCATENKIVVPNLQSKITEEINNSFICDPKQLAEWFAANWWRLLYETEKDNLSPQAQHDWNMSHKIAAAGGGFTWPDITFSTDNNTMRCVIKPTAAAQALIYFLQDEKRYLSITDFESGLEKFINKTTAALGNVDPVSQLWQAVQEERKNLEASVWRKLEAKAGFDPDEAPEDLIETFIMFGKKYGEASIAELVDEKLAQPQATINNLIEELKKSAFVINPDKNYSINNLVNTNVLEVQPWNTAYHFARQLRKKLNWKQEPVNNKEFCDYLSVSTDLIVNNVSNSNLPSAGLKFNDKTYLSLKGSNLANKRFNLARLLADDFYIKNQLDERLLVATNTRTVRQKFQRAFAQELLCPADALFAWMETSSPSDELCEQAAEFFVVSPMLVKHTVENHTC